MAVTATGRDPRYSPLLPRVREFSTDGSYRDMKYSAELEVVDATVARGYFQIASPCLPAQVVLSPEPNPRRLSENNVCPKSTSGE